MGFREFYWRSLWPGMSKLGGHGAIYRELGKVGDFRRTDRVLEIGSGRWPYFKALPKVEAIIVTDADPKTVARCKKSARTAENATFLPADVRGLRFSDNTFDKAFSVNCGMCAHEVRRVLKPGGSFIYAIAYGGGRIGMHSSISFFLHEALPELELMFPRVERNDVGGAMVAIATK